MHKSFACWAIVCFVGGGVGQLAEAKSIYENEAYSIEVLTSCPKYAFKKNEFVLFDGRTNLLTGWSHIDDNPRYKPLTKPLRNYGVSVANWISEPDCGQEKVFSSVLVKKMGDWSGSHANGIEPIIDRANLQFGDVKAVVLEFKIDSANTFFPSKADVVKQFSFAAKASELEALDDQQVNLGITLFEPGFQDQNTQSLNAQTRLGIDNRYSNNQWLRVVIPVSQMHIYLEQHYAPTNVLLADYINHSIMGLRINPETASGKVARNFNPSAWEQNDRPELFKEMGIVFRKVALLLK